MNLPDNPQPVSLTLTALSGIPLVRPGDDLVALIIQSLKQMKMILMEGDILVIAQKIISKSEGRYVRIAEVTPSEQAYSLAESTEKDPQIVELITLESREIVRHRTGVIVAENRQGVVLANAGIDHSNVETDGNAEQVLLLPVDPDASAAKIRKELHPSEEIFVKKQFIKNTLMWLIPTSKNKEVYDYVPHLPDFRKELHPSEEIFVKKQFIKNCVPTSAQNRHQG